MEQHKLNNILFTELQFMFQDREKRNLYIAILLSLIFHIILFMLINFMDVLVIDLSPDESAVSDPVTILFPENKPKQIVENMNENDLIPENSDLLSDRNSRARNPDFLENRANQPSSSGNIPFPNLSLQNQFQSMAQQQANRSFSRQALAGESGAKASAEADFLNEMYAQDASQQTQAQQGTNNMFEQKEFSADELGNLSLSTYAWPWAPYINAFKEKLIGVWFAPAAYYQLGLIHGYTIVRFTINRDGTLENIEVLEHQGHQSLELSSVNGIKAVFPFRPLPASFPDESLTITARMIYPNLRSRR